MNKFIKRCISTAMALILIFSVLTVAPFAADSDVVTLTTTASNFEQGDKVVVTIKFNKKFTGAAALDLGLKYDSTQLEVSSVTKGAAINNARDAQDYDVYSETHSTAGEIKWVFAGSNDYSFSGIFAVVEFKVSSIAKSGKTTVEFVVNEAVSKNHVDVASQITASPLEFNVIRSAESDMHFKDSADKNGYIITAYGSVDRETVEIPSYHYGKPVVGIGYETFANHAEIKSIVFQSPSTLETIEAKAFNGCDNLASIDIPDSVVSIGEGAFEGCAKLKTLGLSYSLTTIDNDAFKGCESLETLSLPFNVVKIGTGAFEDCTKLGTIYISKNTTDIADTAFKNIAETKTIYTVEGNTTIDTYNTNSGLNATISKTLKDLSLGTSTVATQVALVRGGATPEVSVELDNKEAVQLNKDYVAVYVGSYKEGTAKVIVAGIGGYGEGYNLSFNVVCNHDWAKTVTLAPTCTVSGVRSLKCNICDKETTEEIPATGHTSNEWVIDKLPTITTTGLKHKVCMTCKAKFETKTVIDKVVPDADRDGKVNSSDALIVLQYTVGLDVVMTSDALLQVDCNGDGKVNSVDALTILRITVGEIEI